MPDSGDLVDPPRARGAGTRLCPRGGPGCVRGATTTTRRQSGGPAPGSGASSASPEAASRHGPSSSCSSVDRVWFGSDAPAEPNDLYRLRRGAGEIDRTQRVDGPVYYGCASGGRLFFLTTSEPYMLRDTPDVTLWTSADGEQWGRQWYRQWYRQWGRLTVFRKDGWPARRFQHGHMCSCPRVRALRTRMAPGSRRSPPMEISAA